MSDVLHVPGLAYRSGTELDLWLPPDNGPLATILYLHGGGWRRGSRHDTLPGFDGLHEQLAVQGFAVAAVDYRLSGEARFPAQLDDVLLAVDWVRENAKVWGLDPYRVVLWGESAGAHLALLAALNGAEVAGVVAWFPPTDLLGLAGDLTAVGSAVDLGRETELLGVAPADDPELARAASPLTFAHAEAPPILLQHGRADDLVPAAQSIRLAEALQAVGAAVELDLVDKAKHFWKGARDPAALTARAVEFARKVTARSPR